MDPFAKKAASSPGTRHQILLTFIPLLALITSACADLKAPMPTKGFHPAQPFQKPAAGLNWAQREHIYVEQRLRANAIGFLVGYAPMSSSTLALHMSVSGAPDLGQKLLSIDAKASPWNKTSSLAELGVGAANGDIQTGERLSTASAGTFAESMAERQGEYQAEQDIYNSTRGNIGPVPIASLATLGFGMAVNGAHAEAVKIQAEALPVLKLYNLRLLKTLDLPTRDDWASPVKLMPRPLSASTLWLGPNASLADLAWDRAIHAGSNPPTVAYLWIKYRPTTEFLVGGLDVPNDALADYLRSQDAPDLAAQFAEGQSLRHAGFWLSVAGVVAVTGGVIGVAITHPPRPLWPVVSIAVGIGAVVTSVCAMLDGQAKENIAANKFDDQLPTKIRLRLPAGSPAY